MNLPRTLSDTLSYLRNRLGIYPLIGAELEFYVTNVKDVALEELFTAFLKCTKPLNWNVATEACALQYELQTSYGPDIENLLLNLESTKRALQRAAEFLGGNLDFAAKPFTDRPGSAFHVHINLVDRNNKNLFSRHSTGMSDILLHSIGGLCTCMKQHMIFFAPYHQSYLRYIHADNTTPTTVSWGGNNRSTAIRLPDTSLTPENTRIEHRVPGADCNYELAVNAILTGVIRGIEDKMIPPEKIFGIASDPQYNLERLPLSLQETERLWAQP
ncbi:type I glutamate--ammonia ligase [Anaplasma capra]|uniref:glutamine synthetase n=1 Tax=Anaplasma capra TaxID=1562740 RepID=UPI0021D5723A|nr:glutamine synthetase [Anaplasma capra]MCU7611864.1 glutamine synthetase [Anaplasma capra]MCU7612660.1 glutamine synthetase [Anaplasma capra]